MKRLLMALVMTASMAATAQTADKTLFDEEDLWNPYSRFSIALSDVDGEGAAIASVAVGTVLNEKWAIGPSFSVLINDVDLDEGDVERFDLWYAGLRLDYTLHSTEKIHASLFTTIGGGQVDATTPVENDDDSSSMFVLEPGASLAINLWQDVELGVDLSYRFVSGLDLAELGDSDVCGITAGLFIRFTEF